MVMSMTGFGQGQTTGEDFVINIVLRSVNHRHFEANLKIPQELQSFENGIKNVLKEKLLRGSVSCVLQIENTGEISVRVNESLASAYLNAALRIKDRFDLGSELNLDTLLKLPNVVTFGNGEFAPPEQLKEKYGAAMDQALQMALEGMTAMRRQEGDQLGNDLRERVEHVGSLCSRIEQALKSNVDAIYQKLKDEVTRLTQTLNVDPGRLAQEVAYLAERSDVTEEITRLKSHVLQSLQLLKSTGEIGKKLDFLLQEMYREANTILSKVASVFGDGRQASDFAIEIKAEIEKMREQVQNVV